MFESFRWFERHDDDPEKGKGSNPKKDEPTKKPNEPDAQIKDEIDRIGKEIEESEKINENTRRAEVNAIGYEWLDEFKKTRKKLENLKTISLYIDRYFINHLNDLDPEMPFRDFCEYVDDPNNYFSAGVKGLIFSIVDEDYEKLKEIDETVGLNTLKDFQMFIAKELKKYEELVNGIENSSEPETEK